MNNLPFPRVFCNLCWCIAWYSWIGNRCVQAAPVLFSLYIHTRQTSFLPFTMQQHVCKAKKSDHIHPIIQILHWLPVTHLIQYKISAMLHFHLWHIPSVSVWSLLTWYSNKRIIICIRYPNLCYHLCKNNSIWWKSVSTCWPICLEQFISNNLIYSSRLPSRCSIVTISKLSVSQLCLPPPPPPPNPVCVLLVLL